MKAPLTFDLHVVTMVSKQELAGLATFDLSP